MEIQIGQKSYSMTRPKRKPLAFCLTALALVLTRNLTVSVSALSVTQTITETTSHAIDYDFSQDEGK